VEQFGSGGFDVAIIDMGLPGLPGDQLARRLRELDPSLVTVLITGWNLGEGDARLEPFDFYLRKPFGPHEIQRVIDRATDLRNSRL
jgi:CheY-like chemotaxis protein